MHVHLPLPVYLELPSHAMLFQLSKVKATSKIESIQFLNLYQPSSAMCMCVLWVSTLPLKTKTSRLKTEKQCDADTRQKDHYKYEVWGYEL